MNSHVCAPAKINLWLRVYPPDQTGYHPLDTLFCALELSDRIDLAASTSGLSVQVIGADVGPGERNLAYRAALEFFTATGLPAQLAIRLTKRIPAGAGLGGGSSDAAAVLMQLNEMHGNVLPAADVMAMGARLGSDVPFFLCGSRWAHATGRGEILRGVAPLPRAEVLIAMPSFAIATRDAYQWVDEERAFATFAEMPLPRTWDEVAANAENDFERVVFKRHPELADVRDTLRANGASIALLSGSGSALFGVFRDAAVCDHAEKSLRAQLRNVSLLRTHTRD